MIAQHAAESRTWATNQLAEEQPIEETNKSFAADVQPGADRLRRLRLSGCKNFTCQDKTAENRRGDQPGWLSCLRAR